MPRVWSLKNVKREGQVEGPSKVSELENDLNFITNEEASSFGDMKKSVYDPNNDGKVNSAVNADAVPWSGVSNKLVLADQTNQDANLITRSGFYHCNANIPTTDGETDKSVIHNQFGGAGTWATQIAVSWRNGRMWIRNKESGTWEAWVEMASKADIASLPNKLDKYLGVNVRTNYRVSEFGRDAVVSGAIKFSAPAGSKAKYAMVHLEIDIFEYSFNSASKIILGFYNYGGAGWYNYSAKVLGSFPTNLIRIGYDVDKICIVLGDVDTVWGYPKAVVSKFDVGYSDALTFDWSTGWTSELITSIASLNTLSQPYIFNSGHIIKQGGDWTADILPPGILGLVY